MFIPRGFGERSMTTQLGKMAYYTAQGEPWDKAPSQETLVFLHGLGGGSSAYEWSKVYPAFAADYQILAPDLVGWGRSEHPARNYRAEDYIASIIEFLEQTCQAPPTVIASALTAAFTIRAAVERPDLFKSLIVTTAAGLAEFGKDYRQSGFAQFAQSVNVPLLNNLLYGAGSPIVLAFVAFWSSVSLLMPHEFALKSWQPICNRLNKTTLSMPRSRLCGGICALTCPNTLQT
jgi:pimeloyl-ACP methyl ester carboxylesterase